MARILIVDDEQSVREVLAGMLSAEGREVGWAADANEARQRLNEAEYDVVLLDAALPRIGGVELLQSIQAEHPHVQVVILAEAEGVEVANATGRMGAQDYVLKPITKPAVERAVKNAVRFKSLADSQRRLEAEKRAWEENLERLVEERTREPREREARACERAEFSEAILNALAVRVCVLAEDGKILAMNRAWPQGVGAAPAGGHLGTGDNYLTACERATGEGSEPAVAAGRGVRAVGRGEVPEFAMEYPCHTHTPDRQAWTKLRVTRFAAGGQVRMVLAQEDITERKETERRTAETLNLHHTILEASPIGLTAYRAGGEAILANQAMAQLIGISRKDLLAESLLQVETWQRSGVLGRAMEVLASSEEQEVEVCHEPSLGKRLWFVCRIVPFAHAGKPHLLLLATDVTEKKLTEAKLMRAQRMESIGSLASGIAHDLNNILTPILMCAPLLPAEQVAENRDELARIIESSANRAVGIVKQLLSFARGNGGQKPKLQLRYLVRDIARIVRETFPRTIRVEEEIAPNLWPVVGDVTQLHQVMLNLCVNARDAMPSGGRLTLRAANVFLDEPYVSMHQEARPGAFVRFEVEDTGTGIPEAVQAHIFESFFTTKGEAQGSGLGLTMVQGIVREHKGFVGFRTQPDRGTTFEVHFPAVPEAETQEEATEIQASIPRGHGELVLLVDDEPAVCEALRRSLERQGYAVLAAHDGIEALARFAAHQNAVRAVITDCMMPLMDGVTLSRILRALSADTPIVVSSGGLFGGQGERTLQAFAELGVRHILHKPHNAEVLLRILGELLQPSPANGAYQLHEGQS